MNTWVVHKNGKCIHLLAFLKQKKSCDGTDAYADVSEFSDYEKFEYGDKTKIQ